MATRKKSTRRAKRETKAQTAARAQAGSVILLAVAVLLFLIAVIPGENVWTAVHNFMLGAFNVSAYILPLVMAFVSIMMALGKDESRITLRVWECAAFVVMLNSVIYLFTGLPSDLNYWQAIGYAYTEGKARNGSGAFGVLLGYPVEKLVGNTGAKIILILLMAVFFMLITGTTIVSLIRLLRKPVDKTKESFENAIAASAERREARLEEAEKREKKEQSRIDIDMGDGYEEEPAPRRKRRKLTDVFADAGEESADESAEDAAEEDDGEVLPAVAPAGQEKLEALEKAASALASGKDPAPAEAASAVEEISEEIEEKEEEDEERPAYRYPPLSLLEETARGTAPTAAAAEMRKTGQLLVNTLKDFGISTKLVDITSGPAVTRYELEPSAGVKISRITGLADDIALRLATTGVRIEAPIPNKAAVGIEVPNKDRNTVGLRSLLDSADFRNAKGKLTVALGQDIEGNAVLTDLAKMPHLLIAGTTGSGKSVCTNSMIQSVLFRAAPDEVKMILIDPKKVEFGVYNGVPHLLVPVVTDPRKAAGALSWAVNEMLKRYQMFAESNVRDITGYNDMAANREDMKPLPLILIVIDELADLMMAAANEVEDSICRLAQMARAAGMHMVIATQRPSVDVITGLIKANIPSRLALTVASAVDSRTILDAGGAEKLLGYGDMLFMPVGQSKPRRVQGCFVTNAEIERVIDFLKAAEDEQEYDQAVIDEIEKQAAATGKSGGHGGEDEGGEGDGDFDEALPQAIEIAVAEGQVSTSMIMRKLRFGYARAGRIVDQMEQKGIVGPSEGSKPRKVLITRQQWIEMNMNQTEE